ncbi:hypothetical protein VULLAG_LOCUS22140 [Vulpes lagopus]
MAQHQPPHRGGSVTAHGPRPHLTDGKAEAQRARESPAPWHRPVPQGSPAGAFLGAAPLCPGRKMRRDAEEAPAPGRPPGTALQEKLSARSHWSRGRSGLHYCPPCFQETPSPAAAPPPAQPEGERPGPETTQLPAPRTTGPAPGRPPPPRLTPGPSAPPATAPEQGPCSCPLGPPAPAAPSAGPSRVGGAPPPASPLRHPPSRFREERPICRGCTGLTAPCSVAASAPSAGRGPQGRPEPQCTPPGVQQRPRWPGAGSAQRLYPRPAPSRPCGACGLLADPGQARRLLGAPVHPTEAAPDL